MVTIIKWDGMDYYCANCRMRFRKIEESCPFCGCVCTNYEEIIAEILKNSEYDTREKAISF